MPAIAPALQGKSNAYVSFRVALKQAESLLKSERRIPEPTPADQVDLVQALRGGAIVLMVASFEAFLRDVFEERLDTFGQRLPHGTFATLPERIRVAGVYNLLNRAMNGDKGDKRKPVERLADIHGATATVTMKSLVGKAFNDTGSNPNPGTVRELFRQVDYTDAFVRSRNRFNRLWGKPVQHDFAQKKLDSVVSARHTVAHGANALAWSRDDLAEALRFIRILAQTLDEELRIHLNRVRF